MASTTISESWGRWAGTWSEFVSIVRFAVEEAGPSTRFAAVVRLRKRTVSVETIDDLEGVVDAHNRRDVQHVKVEFNGVTGAHVTFTLSASSGGASLAVVGDNLTLVEGLQARLADRIGRLSPSPGRAIGGLMVGVLATAVWITLVLLAVRLGLVGFTNTESRSGVAAILLFFGSIFVFLFAAVTSELLLPHLEILEEPGQHRTRRYRGWIVTIVVGIVIGLLTNALWESIAPR